MELQNFFEQHRLAIRTALPHGSLTILGGVLGRNHSEIQRIFRGNLKETHSDVCRRSMLIIEASSTNDNLVQQYKELIPLEEREVLKSYSMA